MKEDGDDNHPCYDESSLLHTFKNYLTPLFLGRYHWLAIHAYAQSAAVDRFPFIVDNHYDKNYESRDRRTTQSVTAEEEVGNQDPTRLEVVTGQNGSGQNGTDKMVWTKWYTDKMSLDKMVWTKWYGQNGSK